MKKNHANDTERLFSEAQTRIVGRFCSNCRIHRNADGGRLLKSGHNRTRWVCKPCADRYDRTQNGGA